MSGLRMIPSPMACTPTSAPSTSTTPYTEYWRYLKEFTLTPIPRIVKKSCGLPVVVLQETAQSLLAACFTITGTHPLFSRPPASRCGPSASIAIASG